MKIKKAFPKIFLIGFGAVAQGLLPLLIQNLGIDRSKIVAWAADLDGMPVALAMGIQLSLQALTPQNYKQLLTEHVHSGDFLLNLAVEVSSYDLLQWCQQHDVLYLDTSIEPWSGGYKNELNLESSTNHWLREQVLALRKPNSATAVIAHGANPGLISHLTKRALEQLAHDKNIPIDAHHWGSLAQKIGIQLIQIAERDTQTDHHPVAEHEFLNTWSVPGFLSELSQACEAGWGSHEVMLPTSGQHPSEGSQASVYWPHPKNHLLQVKTWVPSVGEGEAYLITHNESISLAEFLTITDAQGQLLYRPTVYFAYQPCPPACLSIARWLRQNQTTPTRQTVLSSDRLKEGQDELGVLLCHTTGAYWYGSTLTLSEARRLAPYNNATTLQVVAGILGALVWMLDNPRVGIVEAEAMDSDQVLAVALPYLGHVGGVHTDWQPSKNWIFQNFIV